MTSSFRPGSLYHVGLPRARCSDAADPALASPRLASAPLRSPARPGPAQPSPARLFPSLPPALRRRRRHVRDPALQRRQGGPLWPRRRGQRALLQLPPPGHQLLGQPGQAAPQAGPDRPGQASGDRGRPNRRGAEGDDGEVAVGGLRPGRGEPRGPADPAAADEPP